MIQRKDSSIMEDFLFEIAHPAATGPEIAVLENRFHFHMPRDIRQFYLKHNAVFLFSWAAV